VGLNINEFKPASIKQFLPPRIPWYVNEDTPMVNYVQKNYVRQLEDEKKYKLLQPVTVTARQRIRGSQNLNGAGEADQVIGEAEIEKAGKMSLLDLLRQKINGFNIIYNDIGDQGYRVNQADASIIIDGIRLSRFGSERETLESLDAEDVTGIEVMKSTRHTGNYKSTFLSLREQMNIIREFAFIEITTRSGNGIFMKKTPGVTIYKPIPVSVPRQFYSPRYIVKNYDEKTTDQRSTIYWQPSVVTNAKGEAFISFYAADLPGTYSIIIQGSDMNGSVGWKIEKVAIKR